MEISRSSSLVNVINNKDHIGKLSKSEMKVESLKEISFSKTQFFKNFIISLIPNKFKEIVDCDIHESPGSLAKCALILKDLVSVFINLYDYVSIQETFSEKNGDELVYFASPLNKVKNSKDIEIIKTIDSSSIDSSSTEKVASPLFQAKNEPIIFEKGKKKEFFLVNKKKHLGFGSTGGVWELEGNPNFAVKISKHNLSKEYKIGNKIDHPNFVKLHALYLKKNVNGTYKSYLIMDKVKVSCFWIFIVITRNFKMKISKSLFNKQGNVVYIYLIIIYFGVICKFVMLL